MGRCWGDVELSRQNLAFSQHANVPVAGIQESCQNPQRPSWNYTEILQGRWNAVMVNAGIGSTALVYWSFSKHTKHAHIFMPLSLCSLCLEHPQVSDELNSFHLMEIVEGIIYCASYRRCDYGRLHAEPAAWTLFQLLSRSRAAYLGDLFITRTASS